MDEKHGKGFSWLRSSKLSQQSTATVLKSIMSCRLISKRGTVACLTLLINAGNLLKPMLGRGELRCIGATTLDEYRKYIEKDPALERRFQQVFVDQPSVVDTISILRGLRERWVFLLLWTCSLR